MTLFEECLRALGKDAVTLSQEDTKKNFEDMETIFPFTSWGKIDWNKVDRAIHI